jgi:hypothetical protein
VHGGGDRPPLLRSVLQLSVAGRDERQLEERVERLRESYGRVQLHRPAGEQHRLFSASLPAAPFPLLERISRLGRSQNISPILASQILGDAEALEPLVGAFFAFGVETAEEAARALALLRLDAEGEAATQRLLAYRRGRCYLRDFSAQVTPIQVEPPGWMLERLDTTPGQGEVEARPGD